MKKGYYITSMLAKSVACSIIVCAIMYGLWVYLKTYNSLADLGGISVFASIYGTLYGIAVGLVLLEVWGQFNKTSELIDKEAIGLERLYGLVLYLRDKAVEIKIKTLITKYSNLIKKNFEKLSVGYRDPESGKVFRTISSIIKGIKFNDDHDSVVFGKIIDHYNHLSEIRTERTNQSLARLPGALKAFLYISSFFAILILILMPYQNIFYGFLVTGILTIMITLIFQIINDLDNPFSGFWTITPEPFERAIKHIEEDY